MPVPTSVADKALTASSSPPYHVWFERDPPPAVGAQLDGVAVLLGNGAQSIEERLRHMTRADAAIAGPRVDYSGVLMDTAPGLKVISRTGAGVDNISIADATVRGIAVCNAPDAPAISTAEHALALLLATAKRLKRAERAVRAGRSDIFNDHSALELYGTTLGIVGLGRIGRRVAAVARSLEMQVVAFDPYVSPVEMEIHGVLTAPDLPTLLKQADFVSIHVPLTDETRQMFGREMLAEMKSGAILINTARGEIVDEGALVEALDSGRLSGAGLDVLNQEPPATTNPLLDRDDVIVTPHVAAATIAARERLWSIAISQALQVLRGERPPNVVNAELYLSQRVSDSLLSDPLGP